MTWYVLATVFFLIKFQSCKLGFQCLSQASSGHVAAGGLNVKINKHSIFLGEEIPSGNQISSSTILSTIFGLWIKMANSLIM